MRFTLLFILFSVLIAQEGRLEDLNRNEAEPGADNIRQEIEAAGRVNFERIQVERRPDQFVGTWQGRGFQEGKGDWPVQLELLLSGVQGELKGRVLYPTLGCEAQLRFSGWEGRTAIFTEHYEKPGKCIPNGLVHLAPDGLDALRYAWKSPNGKEAAQGVVIRCAESFEPVWAKGSMAKDKGGYAQAVETILVTPEERKIQVAQDARLDEEKVREREIQEKKTNQQELQKRMQELQQVARQRQQEERELERKLQERQREAERKYLIRREEERKRAAAEEARWLAAKARAAQEALARTRAAAKAAAVQSAATNTTAGRQGAQSMVEQSYWGRVAERVKSKWALPEMRVWDATLLAQVYITINRNGDVVKIEFENRSRDPLFDQVVEKTIRSAAPMPPFPPLMQQATTEVGFKFKPGELGNM